MKKTTYPILLLLVLVITNSCIEEFNAGTNEFEDVIVIEASLTNEFKHQKVILSRTYKFEENQPEAESGAIIQITSSSNNTYTFQETEPGVYLSDIQFSALPNIDYQLNVATSNGREYTSQPTKLTSSSSNIENVYATREVNEEGVDGIRIYIDSFDPTNSSQYYSYSFEETYQIIAPYWKSDQLVLVPATATTPLTFAVVPRTQEERVCYVTLNSQGRLITKSDLLTEDRVSNFFVKSFPVDDIRNSSRYSIIVKQYTLSAESYNFHKTLNDFSNSESLFSQNQPGFVAGNIFSGNNPNEKVLGFFEVSSVAQQRIFFNRSDYITDQYPWEDCEPYVASTPPLTTLIRTNKVSWFQGIPSDPEPILVVNRKCGDCTEFGSNIRPSFWID